MSVSNSKYWTISLRIIKACNLEPIENGRNRNEKKNPQTMEAPTALQSVFITTWDWSLKSIEASRQSFSKENILRHRANGRTRAKLLAIISNANLTHTRTTLVVRSCWLNTCGNRDFAQVNVGGRVSMHWFE